MDDSRPHQQTSKSAPALGEYRWLIELRDRLPVAIDLLDAQGHLPLPPHSGDVSQRLRRWLVEAAGEAVSAVIEQSRQAGDVAFTTVDWLRVGAFSLPQGRNITLFAAEPSRHGPEEARRHYLQSILAWLAPREGTPGSHAAASIQDWRGLRTLEQVLSQASASGSEQETVRAFVEAIAVWHDIDVRGYVADLNERLTLDVSLPRARAGVAPSTLPWELPGWAVTTYLDARNAADVGFVGVDNVVLVNLDAAGMTPRAVAFVGALKPYDEVRFAIYGDVLRRSLQLAAEIESSRLIWALMQRLVGNHESIEDAILSAATELSQFAICTLAVTIHRDDGVVVLAVEQADEQVENPLSAAERLSFPLALSSTFSGTLTLRRPPANAFTAREHRLGEVAASVLASWLGAALRGGRLYRDRRALSGNFDELIAQRASRANQDEADLSLVVFRPLPDDQPTDRMRACVGEIRRQLRPFDVAGTLTTGEIGVLLPNTPADRARAVAERLRRSFQDNSRLSPLGAAAIGIASRGAGAGDPETLVEQARERAGAEGPDQ